MTARAFDTAVAASIAKLPDLVYKPFVLIGYIASPLAWGVIIFIILAFRLEEISLATIILLLALPIATLVKFAFRRNRPPTIYAGSMRIKSYSFPSSHSYSSALVGVYAAHGAALEHSVLLASAFLAIALIVGVSRVYLGAHYPSDVVAGWTLGAVIAGVIAVCL